MLRVQNLSFTYPNGYQALTGIDLEVTTGQKVALVGPNGAGKSTLFLRLIHLLRGTGQVEVAGVPVTERTLRQVRALVGLVFQDPNDQLFSTTVGEDVAFGPLHAGQTRAEVHQRVAAALAAVGMAGYEEHLPPHLSLGQRKRVALATVLAMDPPVLLLDEPSAGLDPRARRNLIALLTTLSQTMLIATHDMRLAWTLCPRTVILDDGHLVADGPTAQLLQDAALLGQHGLEAPGAPLPFPAGCGTMDV